jgi:transposase InsO family protein
LSRSQIAKLVRVDKNTIARWETEVTRSPAPERTTIGALVKPQPPVRRYADVVRGVVQAMALAGFGGHQMIASTLARAGWRLSKRTVARIRKERYVRPTSPPPTPEAAKRHRVSARYPNHLFMLDITEIPSLFRILLFRLAVVFDAFSRMPLAASISAHEPTGDETAQLLRTAIHNHSAPRHLVTDHGSQFTSDDFKQPVNQAAIRHRFGAVHRTGSIALIERIWRTIKNLAGLRRRPPLTLDDCRRRVDLALLHYAYCRPHRALGGATPAEVHFGITPAHRSAIHGPTGRPGKLTVEQPFEILYLDDEQHLPFLFNNAA